MKRLNDTVSFLVILVIIPRFVKNANILRYAKHEAKSLKLEASYGQNSTSGTSHQASTIKNPTLS